MAQALLGSAGLILLTYVCYRLGMDLATTALLDLIAIVLLSLTAPFSSVAVGAISALLSLDYFLVPPVLGLGPDVPFDSVALAAFLTTALVISRLVSKVRQSLLEIQAASEQRREAVDTVPALIWSTHPDGSSEFNNERWLEYTGLTLEQAQDWGYTSAFHPEDYQRLLPKWTAAFQSGDTIEDEARLRRADGEYRWFLHRAVPVRDGGGNIIRWYGTSTDIEDRKRAEELLLERASLLDLTHDTIFVRNMDDVITYWNVGAEKLYGWSRAEAVGRVSHELTQTVFPAPLDEITATLHRTGRWEGELVHSKRDGSRVTVASRWSLRRDERGRPVGTLETNNDITKRKLAEEAARRSQKMLRDVVNTVPAQFWSALPDGTVDFVNERWEDYSGQPPEQALGWNWAGFIHPDDRPRFVAEWQAALAHGQAMESEARVRRADGAFRWWIIRNVPLRDDQGTIIRWYGTGVDIEDRKQAEEALRRSEAYLSEAQRLTHTGSWAGDPSTGAATHWSEEMFRIFALDPQEGLPTRETHAQRIHPEDVDRVYEQLRKAVSQKGDYVTQYRVVHPDGTVKYVEVIGHPVLDESGEVLEYVGTIVDVTERKRAEHAVRRARDRALKARFAAVLGERTRLAREIHDTLLQGFTGVALQLVAASSRVSGPPEATQALSDVVSLAQKTLVDARRAVWDLRPPALIGSSLPEVLRTTAEDSVRGTGLTLEYAVDGPPRGVGQQAEAVALRMVQEAITNTVKHAHAQSVRVRLSFKARCARVSIRDDGRGFDFDPTYQTYGGHWGLLGLRERAAQVRGKLSIRSASGQGTELVLLLPYARGLASPPSPAPVTAASSGALP